MTPREVAKCLDPKAFGFELERSDIITKDGGMTSNPRDSLPMLTEYDSENKKPEVKSVIVQCETMEKRDQILKSINKRKLGLKAAEDAFANPKMYEKIYEKKCACIKIPIPYKLAS